MSKRNSDEHDDATRRIPIRRPTPAPVRGGYSPLKKGALPKNRDRRETIPMPKENPQPEIGTYLSHSRTLSETIGIWFLVTEYLKNGNLRGLQVEWWSDGRRPRKAAQTSIQSFDIRNWHEVQKSDVPEKVLERFEERRRNNPYTGPQVATSQGHVHSFRCNPMKLLTYGNLPPRAAFIRGIDKAGPFHMDLKGQDLRAAQKVGWDGEELDGEELYDLVAALAKRWHDAGDDHAGDLASGILTVAGYEWV